MKLFSLLKQTLILVAALLIATPMAFAVRGKPKKMIPYQGIAQLDKNCSSSLIRFHQSLDSDHGILLMSAHCMRYMSEAVAPELVDDVEGVDAGAVGFFITNYKLPERWIYPVQLKNYKTGQRYNTRVENIMYATGSTMDIALVRLDETYGFLKEQGIEALTLSSEPAKIGDEIAIPSGLYDKQFDCKIDTIVPFLMSNRSYYRNALRYSTECAVYVGTSGSPVISVKTGQVIGVNNFRSDPTEKPDCITRGLCEIHEGGVVKFNPYLSGYGLPVHQIYSCLNEKRQIDLSLPACKLFGGVAAPN